jgi:multisubunit Na+/H+ antiporter MnhB subunit
MVPQSLLVGIGIAFGGVILAIAIASFVVAYGLLKGLGWAWTVTVILSIISIIISGIILYYLYRPHVKAYFGKGISRPPSAA